VLEDHKKVEPSKARNSRKPRAELVQQSVCLSRESRCHSACASHNRMAIFKHPAENGMINYITKLLYVIGHHSTTGRNGIKKYMINYRVCG